MQRTSFLASALLVACTPAAGGGGSETSGGEADITRTVGTLSCTVSGATTAEADLILVAVDTHASEVIGCGTDELVLATDAGTGPLRVDGASTNLDCVTAAMAGYEMTTSWATTTRCRRLAR